MLEAEVDRRYRPTAGRVAGRAPLVGRRLLLVLHLVAGQRVALLDELVLIVGRRRRAARPRLPAQPQSIGRWRSLQFTRCVGTVVVAHREDDRSMDQPHVHLVRRVDFQLELVALLVVVFVDRNAEAAGRPPGRDGDAAQGADVSGFGGLQFRGQRKRVTANGRRDQDHLDRRGAAFRNRQVGHGPIDVHDRPVLAVDLRDVGFRRHAVGGRDLHIDRVETDVERHGMAGRSAGGRLQTRSLTDLNRRAAVRRGRPDFHISKPLDQVRGVTGLVAAECRAI